MLWLMQSNALKVLVLCTGNSCRSIMAEALINTLARGRYHAWSAGAVPTGYVHPKSIETLQRHGVNLGHPRSKSVSDVVWQSFDLIITVCDQAAEERCPMFPGTPATLHWSTPDPAKVIGNETEINAAFDEAFFMLKHRVEELMQRQPAHLVVTLR